MNKQIIAKELLLLARHLIASNVLYHVTKYENAENILKHNYFRPTMGQRLRGLSTTTDKNYNWGSTQVKFVLDRNKLQKDYKLIDEAETIYTDTGELLNESEVVVESDKAIMNADKYIIEVRYTEGKKYYERDYQDFLKQLEKTNIKSRKVERL